mgnify:FL=1
MSIRGFEGRGSFLSWIKLFKQSYYDCLGSAHKLLHILFAKCPVFWGLLQIDYVELFMNGPLHSMPGDIYLRFLSCRPDQGAGYEFVGSRWAQCTAEFQLCFIAVRIMTLSVATLWFCDSERYLGPLIRLLFCHIQLKVDQLFFS